MPVPNTMADLAQLAGSNSPPGTEAIGNSLDNYLRALSAILRSTNALSSATIAAASTTDLATSDAESVQVTGAATITSLGTGFNGCYREVRFSGAPTLVHSSNLILPYGANISVSAGEVFAFRCIGAGIWVQVGRAKGDIGYAAVNKAGDTMTGPLTISGGSASLKLADRDGVGVWDLYALNDVLRAYNGTTDVVEVDMTGQITADGRVRTQAGHFNSTTNAAILSAESGQISFRPNGADNTSGEGTYATNGNFTAAGRSRANAHFNSTSAGAVLSAEGGPVFLRPNGSDTTTGQTVISTNGSLQINSGFAILKVTVSSSAPGALSDGEIWFQTS